MSSNTVTIIAAIIGVSGAVLAALLPFLLSQKQSATIRYTTSSMAVLRLRPKFNSTLRLLTDKSLLTGREGDQGVDQVINEAYVFEVYLTNTGREDITHKTDITIQLHEAAKILSCQVDPGNSYQPEIQRGREPSAIIITLPYIKAKGQALIRLISTENKDRTCEVEAIGRKVRIKPIDAPTNGPTDIVVLGFVLAVGGAAAFGIGTEASYPIPFITSIALIVSAGGVALMMIAGALLIKPFFNYLFPIKENENLIEWDHYKLKK